MNQHLTALLVALGCGLLMGVERERRKGSGSTRSLAGISAAFSATLWAGSNMAR